ncbi:MAG: DNA polymerase III subunit alpha [Candidatus Shikimatogenerans bostrichidophilus]|nr:MAG: DNA polymerase III subunit alpha [Candidatus Shikimatogenerans bostrichidophilus]
MNWPRLIQISWQLYDNNGKLIKLNNYFIKPDNFKINKKSFLIHGINKKLLKKRGKNIKYVLNKFYKYLKLSTYIIGHNIDFDINIINGEFFRLKKNINKIFLKKKKIDTQKALLNNNKFNITKWLNLKQTFYFLYKKNVEKELFHNSFYDVYIIVLCFIKLLYYKIINIKYKVNIFFFLKNVPSLKDKKLEKDFFLKKKKKNYYFNIHNNTNYTTINNSNKNISIINIDKLIDKAIKYKMLAIGITDNNMMASYYFLTKIYSVNNNFKKNIIKGILGYNFYLKDNKDNFFCHTLIAKNKKGYYNLIKICSYSYINNNKNLVFIDKKKIIKYKEGLIFLTGNLNSEISYNIINNNIKKSIEILLFWKKIFKDDIYIEIFRDGFKKEKIVNKYLLRFSKLFNIPFINQSNNFYLSKKEYIIHDIFLCIKNKEKKRTPIISEFNNYKLIKKGYRYGLPNNNFYFKNFLEIKNNFNDIKKGFKNLKKIYKKIENIIIKPKNLFPIFKLSNKKKKKIFKNKKYDDKKLNKNYLKYLIYKGAKKKYKKLNNKIKKRIKKEFKVIINKNFENYFLIVYDIINNAKKKGIYIGPGRGSVAGSIIAYCIDITKIDPLKYNLIFERFLNEERFKMPDIDIDLDNKNKNKLIDYIIKKYTLLKVCNIITFGKIGTKSSIRDVSRIFNLPLEKVNFLSKLIVKKLNLTEILHEDINLLKKKTSYRNINNILRIRSIYNNKKYLESKILFYAKYLEGLIRNTGIHACGIIISNEKIINNIPVMLNKNKNYFLSQYDTYSIEKIGLLKIDLLSLKTLNVIKNTIKIIKKNKKKINFSLKDKKTFDLFKKGNTLGIFQYDSKGMIKTLKLLKPNNLNDLIALNALYRPGPIKYIPNFIARKNGKEKVVYDIPIMKKYLKETYGITIYQEQVIFIARKLSGISKSEADILREAIGKKKIYVLNTIKKKFFEQSIKNGYNINSLNKIWLDWENFASYAFNKSHATCYTYIAFQTAFLKANYTLEYMTTLLSNNLNNKNTLKSLLLEINKLKINILPPNINKNKSHFTIENKGIRFCINAIKGIGKACINNINKNKNYFLSFLDFILKINLRIINKRVLEILIFSGTLDGLGIKRYYYIKNINSIIKKILKYKNKKKYILNNNNLKIKDYFKEKFKLKIKRKKKFDTFKKIDLYINYINKRNEILGFNFKLKKHILYFYKFEIQFFKTKTLKFIFSSKIKRKILFLICLVKNILYKNNLFYWIILEDHKYNIKKIKIKKKNILKKKIKINSILFIKLYINYYKKIYILFFKKIRNIYNKYEIIVIKMYKNILYNLYKKIIKKIIIKINSKRIYTGEKKIYIILYNNNIDKKKILIKKIINININREMLTFLKKIPKIKLLLI